MLNCKEVVKIISSEDRRTWRRMLKVRFHLMICQHCRKYTKQIEILKNGLKKVFTKKISPSHSQRIKDIENQVLAKARKSDPT